MIGATALIRASGDSENPGPEVRIDALTGAYATWLREHERLYSSSPAHPVGAALSILLIVPDGCSHKKMERTLRSLRRQTLQPYAMYAVCSPREAAVLTDAFAGQKFECHLKVVGDPEGWLNSLMQCKGTWVGALWAGDDARPWMLAEVARCVASHADIELVYSDWDHADPSGPRDPVFTPGWSPVLLERVNYVGARCFIRGEWARQHDGGSPWTDWHSFLRSVAHARAAVAHIPAPLVSVGEPFRVPQVSSQPAGESVTPLVSVSIMIPTRLADEGALRACLRGLLEGTAYLDLEIILLINNLADGQAIPDWLQRLPVRLVQSEGPFNWSATNNRGAALAQGDYLLFLNDDVEVVEPGWLGTMVNSAMQYGAAIVGPLLLYPGGLIQHAGINFVYHGGGAQHLFRGSKRGEGNASWLATVPREVSGVTGACMLVGKREFDELGGFDERYALVSNDTDFCLRARHRGLTILAEPRATLVHHEGLSRGGMEEMPDVLRFWDQWEPALRAGDEYWNPNLSIDDDSWQVDARLVRKHPPRISRRK
jgi:hypothetical protein